ncbi:DUF6682 family protein [Streptomyces sp. NPDC048720]|uniref:phage adaptor protein n=1 Tax=Streptomyces sp. NPDC048720 TaxID=3365588 RepID=UPI00371346E5
MNVADVANRVRRIFGDDDGVQITDDDIFRWVNDAQLEISTENEELLETVATSDIVSAQAEYTMPTDCNVLRSLMYNNMRIRGLSFAEFNEYLDGFKVPQNQGGYGNARPEVYMVYGGIITLFPTPNENIINGLRIYYSKHPASVGNMADGLGVPDRYHNSIVQFCLQQAYEMDENADMAAFKGNQFSAHLQKLKDQEKRASTEYYPTITTLPGDEMDCNFGGFYG